MLFLLALEVLGIHAAEFKNYHGNNRLLPLFPEFPEKIYGVFKCRIQSSGPANETEKDSKGLSFFRIQHPL